MRLRAILILILSALSAPALAEEPSPGPREPSSLAKQQAAAAAALDQMQSKFLAAQSDFYAAAARKLQVDLAISRKEGADTAAWWNGWWNGMYPPPAEEKKE